MTTRRGFLKALALSPAVAVAPAVVATDSPMSVQKYIARTLPMFPELDGRDYFSYSGGMTWIDTEAAIRDILRAEHRHWLKYR